MNATSTFKTWMYVYCAPRTIADWNTQFWPASCEPHRLHANPMPSSSVQMFAVVLCTGDGEQSSPSGREQDAPDVPPSAPHMPGNSPSPTTGSNESASLA